MAQAPDLLGFRGAQVRLIDGVGASVTFGIPSAAVWPSSAAIDPESGEPFDPRVLPASGGTTSAVVKTALVSLGAGATDDVSEQAVGAVESADVTVAVKPSDYSAIEDATTVTVFGVIYDITEKKAMGLDSPDSYTIYGRER